MSNIITTQPSSLEQAIVGLHTKNPQTQEWFFDTVVSILENQNISSYQKSDRISEAFMSLASKIAYIKEQQKNLTHLRKQLEAASSTAKEQVAKALLSFGIEKLEGVTASSISINKASEKSVSKMEILNEDALIKAGFFTVLLDKEAVEQAMYSADQRHEIEKFVHITNETVTKPASIRINKRKSVITAPTTLTQIAQGG